MPLASSRTPSVLVANLAEGYFGPVTHRIFFSWQSDTTGAVGRNLIQAALKRAIAILKEEAEVDPADRELIVDRDTRNVPGMPPIVETIFEKIDGAAVFVSDLTYVAERIGGGGSPNPNVCIEHGYALKALGWRRMIGVMNIAYGDPEKQELPFDLRHVRRPIPFDLPDGPDIGPKKVALDKLARQFAEALRWIFDDETAKASMRPAAPADPHPHDVALLTRVHEQLSAPLRLFLRQQDFGAPFLLAAVDPLQEMNEVWIGAAYEFHDPELQAAFAPIQQLARDLGSLILVHVYAMDGNHRMGTAKTTLDQRQGIQPHSLAAVAKMNSASTKLVEAIDAFDRLARDRIRAPVGDQGAPAVPVADPRAEKAQQALEGLAFDLNRGRLPSLVSRPRLTVRLVPFEAMEGRRLDLKKVVTAQLRFPPLIDDRAFSDSDGTQWWTRGEEYPGSGPNPECRWRMRLVRPGSLEFQINIGSRTDDDAEILVDGSWLEAMIVRHLERMANLAQELGFEGPALVHMALDGLEDVVLTQSRSPGRKIGKPDHNSPVIRLADLSAPMASELHEPLDMLWQASGWGDGSPSFANGVWAGYSDDPSYRIDS